MPDAGFTSKFYDENDFEFFEVLRPLYAFCYFGFLLYFI